VFLYGSDVREFTKVYREKTGAFKIDAESLRDRLDQTGSQPIEIWHRTDASLQPVWHYAHTDAFWLRNIVLVVLASLQIESVLWNHRQRFSRDRLETATWFRQLDDEEKESAEAAYEDNRAWMLNFEIFTAFAELYGFYRNEHLPYDETSALYFWFCIATTRGKWHNTQEADQELNALSPGLGYSLFRDKPFLEQPIASVSDPRFMDSQLYRRISTESDEINSIPVPIGDNRVIWLTASQKGRVKDAKGRRDQMTSIMVRMGVPVQGVSPNVLDVNKSSIQLYLEKRRDAETFLLNNPWLVHYNSSGTVAPYTLVLHCLSCTTVSYEHNRSRQYKLREKMISVLEFDKNPVVPFLMRFCRLCCKRAEAEIIPIALYGPRAPPAPPMPPPPPEPLPLNDEERKLDRDFQNDLLSAITRLSLHREPPAQPFRFDTESLVDAISGVSAELALFRRKEQDEKASLSEHIRESTRYLTQLSQTMVNWNDNTLELMNGIAARIGRAEVQPDIERKYDPAPPPQPAPIPAMPAMPAVPYAFGGYQGLALPLALGMQPPALQVPGLVQIPRLDSNRRKVYRIRYEERKE
jgi:hypothetical protein